jgi:cob(I)alamin adenosyltransferase
MAQNSQSNLHLDTMTRSKSSSSIASNGTVDSSRSIASSRFSTISTRRRRGILGKIETGFQSICRRFSRTRTTLTEMEIQILSTMTNFNREEVLKW